MPVSPEQVEVPQSAEQQEFDAHCAYIDNELAKISGLSHLVTFNPPISQRMYHLIKTAYSRSRWVVTMSSSTVSGGQIVVSTMRFQPAPIS